VYYMDNIAGIGFVPTEYVDITSVMETKLRMLRCHKSQFTAISELAHRDLEQVTESSRASAAWRAAARSPRDSAAWKLATRPEPPPPAMKYAP
jgi:Uncharacterized proteins, LmbE homologs